MEDEEEEPKVCPCKEWEEARGGVLGLCHIYCIYTQKGDPCV